MSVLCASGHSVVHVGKEGSPSRVGMRPSRIQGKKLRTGGVNFVDPRPGGGSLLDHDSGGLGESLSTNFPPFPPRSAEPIAAPLPPQRHFSPCPTENQSNKGYYFGGRTPSDSSRVVALCTLRTQSDCEFNCRRPNIQWSHVSGVCVCGGVVRRDRAF